MENITIFLKIRFLPPDLKKEVNYIDLLLSRGKKDKSKNLTKFGVAKGSIYTSPNFDEPVDDFKDYM